MEAADRQTDGVVVEVETQPRRLLHEARDWGELLLTRQLVEPLFVEGPGRSISSKLFSGVVREDRHTWRLVLCDEARWSDGTPIAARDVCEQLRRAALARGAATVCLAFLAELRLVDQRTVQLITRVPVGEVGRLLTCPAAGPAPRARGVASGKYSLARRQPDHTVLTRPDRGPQVTAVTFADRSAYDRAVATGALDASSLTTGANPAWDGQPGHFVSAADLDVLVGLDLPAVLGPATDIARAIDRAAIARAERDLLRPIRTLTGLWTDTGPTSEAAERSVRAARAATRSERERGWPLYYAEFEPNRKVARMLADQLWQRLGLRLVPVKRPYEEFIMDRERAQDAFRLTLTAPAWTHPVAPLAPAYLRSRRSGSAPEEFLRRFEAALAAESPAEAVRRAALAERLLAGTADRPAPVPVAGLRAQMRHRGPANLWIPPSGLLDFTSLSDAHSSREAEHR
ncbi:ABC transporter substrate-binding protein [Streptomyces sp. IBSBF 3136]|uniref:ABC transporter substrate-binding protein n=1 Tax=Streptomyces sp. IBSBF 3136 TaxID=2903524 RepID=UPI002FDC594A